MFDSAFDTYIKLEGGYSDHKDDRGGSTRFGVTEFTARRHGYEGKMTELPLETAKKIIKEGYWDKFWGDRLSEQTAEKMLNIATNMGVRVAVKMLQRVLNALRHKQIAEDGIMGRQTLGAYNDVTHTGDEAIVKYLNCLQGKRYIEIVEGNTKQKSFIVGWARRLR